MKVQINHNSLQLMIGDITKQQVDAIVNAANGTLLGGGGVDGAIHRAAGPELLQECKQFREKVLHGDYLRTGEVALTKGYNLPATYVIHTVGPIWDDDNGKKETQLGQCYRNSLELATKHSVSSIAFPSISTGVYRFPIEFASMIALQTIVNFLKSHSFGDVTMVLFSNDDLEAYQESLNKIIKI